MVYCCARSAERELALYIDYIVLDCYICTISGAMMVYCCARSAEREPGSIATTVDKCAPHAERSSEGKSLEVSGSGLNSDPNLSLSWWGARLRKHGPGS